MGSHQLLREIVRVELRQFAREVIKEEVPPESAARIKSAYSEPTKHGTYKGDSLAKKSARLRVWEAVHRAPGQNIVRGLHVFLASHEGGDASTLRGLGVPDSAMLAVDSDQSAVREFRTKFPEVQCRNADIASVLNSSTLRPTSVFLDFSSQVSDNTFSKVKAAVHGICPGGVLACTFAIGREKNWSGSKQDACEARLQMVEDFIKKELSFKPVVLLRLRYMSESTTGPGSSIMCVIVVQIAKGKDAENSKLQTLGLNDLYRDIYRYRNSSKLHWLINCTEENTESLRARVKEYPPPRVT